MKRKEKDKKMSEARQRKGGETDKGTNRRDKAYRKRDEIHRKEKERKAIQTEKEGRRNREIGRETEKDRKRQGEGRKSDGAGGPVSSLEGHAINNKNLTSFCTGQGKEQASVQGFPVLSSV